MKNDINEGPLNTLGTSIRSGLAKKRDTTLGGFGAAQERLGLRVAADQNVKNWVNWIARQRYGGAPVEGNADDLRRFIKQYYGEPALQQVEPAIQRIAPPVQAPQAPQQIPAPAAAPMMSPENYPPMSIPSHPNNPEVPDWLANQRNQTRPRPDVPPPSAHPTESIRIGGKLIEVALKRSQIDTVMKQLAIAQADSGQIPNLGAVPQQPGQAPQAPQAQTQPNQVATTAPQVQPPQAQPQAQAQPSQTASTQQPQQPKAAPINVSQILGAQVSAAGLKRAGANLSARDKSYINDALSNGPIALEELLDQLPEVKGETVVGLLKALAHSN